MTNTRFTFYKRAIAAFAAIVMLVAAFFGLGVAKADSAGGEEAADPGTNFKRELHYFSDYENRQAFADGLKAAGALDKVEVYDCYPGMPYIGFIQSHLNAGTFNYISDSYVIVEMRQGFSFQVDRGDNAEELLPNIFKEIFTGLKDRGCKIMFVCGTDELRFTNSSEFLRSVDIHVNTDIFGTYLQNIFGRISASCGGTVDKPSFSNCTLILDKTIADGELYRYEIVGTWFFHTYLIPAIRLAYIDFLYATGDTVENVVKSDNMSILCHLYGSQYYDLFEDRYVDLLNEGGDYFIGKKVYAMGSTQGDVDYAEDWISNVLEIRANYEYYAGVFPVYVYDAYGLDLSYYYESEVYTAHNANNYLIYDVMVDFVNDGDLAPYNNYEGMCDISYKVLSPGANGWLYLPGSGEIEYFTWWDIIMNEDDAAYYFSVENIFNEF